MKKKLFIVFLLIPILVLVSCQNNEIASLKSSRPENSSVGKTETKHSSESKGIPSSRDESLTAGISPTPDERSDPELERVDESSAQQSCPQAVQSSFSSEPVKNSSENKEKHNHSYSKAVIPPLVPLRDIPAILAHAEICIPMIEFQHWGIRMANGRW